MTRGEKGGAKGPGKKGHRREPDGLRNRRTVARIKIGESPEHAKTSEKAGARSQEADRGAKRTGGGKALQEGGRYAAENQSRGARRTKPAERKEQANAVSWRRPKKTFSVKGGAAKTGP